MKTPDATRTREVNQKLGRRLRHLREARGYTTTTLGKAAGLSQGQISRLETGIQGIRAPILSVVSKSETVRLTLD